jgi:hypothetical protein
MVSVDGIRNFFQRRRTNFRLTYMSPAGRQVLADLEEFCCASSTTMKTNDPIALARNEGRRQVWLRIRRAINLTADEQLAILSEKDKPNG